MMTMTMTTMTTAGGRMRWTDARRRAKSGGATTTTTTRAFCVKGRCGGGNGVKMVSLKSDDGATGKGRRGTRATRIGAIVDREDQESSSASPSRGDGKRRGEKQSSKAKGERRGDEDGSERWKWRRVMLKVSGEALAGDEGFGISPDVVKSIASEVAEAAVSGIEVAVVVGGGNFFRGAEKEGNGLDRASADYMGMLATVMNSLNLQAAIESHGVPTRVMSALEIKEVAEPYIRRRAIRHLEKGRVVIFGAGTGNPFFTTDTGAALRAAEINAQAVLKATKVDGIFDSDPKKNPDAKLYKTLTYKTVRHENLAVMDQTAITLCEENDIPVVVFNISRDRNIVKALRGASVGTCVGSSSKCADVCED
jgi:uridylate kinase